MSCSDLKSATLMYSVVLAGCLDRYYPHEWNNLLCRSRLDQSPQEERRATFDEICARNSPSLRFFFVERFSHSMELWHAAKMNFTRSVAVSSIVGHILGIGKAE
jgi:serine-protein kinase ATM